LFIQQFNAFLESAESHSHTQYPTFTSVTKWRTIWCVGISERRVYAIMKGVAVSKSTVASLAQLDVTAKRDGRAERRGPCRVGDDKQTARSDGRQSLGGVWLSRPGRHTAIRLPPSLR